MSHFYPEMDQKLPATAIIVGSICTGGAYIKWSDNAHATVLDALAVARIKPRDMEAFQTVNDERKWSGFVTRKAYSKLLATGLVATMALL